MDNTQILDRIALGLQDKGFSLADHFLEEELSLAVNIAQERFISQRLGNAFQIDQQGLDDLRVLVKQEDYSISPDPLEAQEHYLAELPEDYLHLVSARVMSSSGERNCRIIASNQLDIQMDNPFTSPGGNHLLGTLMGNNLRVQGDKKSILKGHKLLYIRKAQEIDLSSSNQTDLCELAEHTHQEIIELTVQYLLEVTANPRVQTHVGNLASEN